MTHEDRGHYAKKHPPDRKVQPEIAEALKQKATKRKVSCAAAHKIAGDLNVPPAEVGFTIDTLEIRIIKCQMGLYGYHPEKRIVKPAETVTQSLEKAIRDALVNGKIECAAAWDIAKKFGIARMDVSSACETLKVKISSCQLGAF